MQPTKEELEQKLRDTNAEFEKQKQIAADANTEMVRLQGDFRTLSQLYAQMYGEKPAEEQPQNEAQPTVAPEGEQV